MAMKTIWSWLGDPQLHLLAVVMAVVALGVAGSSGGGGEPCDFCHRIHDEARPCPQAVATAPEAPVSR
jgi:hypothetical protein